MPSGSARLRSTSIVCGKQRSDTRNMPCAVAELLALHAVQQRHRLARRRALVQQRRVGHLHPRQVRDHRLEVEERLEAALRDLGLIRRVRRVPARVLEHAAADHARRQRVGVAEADEAAEHLVLLRDRLEPRQIGGLAFRGRQVERRLEADAGGNGFVDQRVERRRRRPALSIAATSSPRGPMWRGSKGVERRENGTCFIFESVAS